MFTRPVGLLMVWLPVVPGAVIVEGRVSPPNKVVFKVVVNSATVPEENPLLDAAIFSLSESELSIPAVQD